MKWVILSMMIHTIYACSNCVDLSFHSCEVCYEDCEEGVKFISCHQTVCSSWSTNSDGERYCSSYSTLTHSESSCFTSCCGDVVNSQTFSIPDLQECEQYNTRASITLYATIGSVFLFICIIICGCLCRDECDCCDNCSCTCCCESMGQCCERIGQCCSGVCCGCCLNKERQAPNKSMEQLKEGTDIWIRQAYMQQILQCNQSCGICLQEYANSISSCQHFFHLQCALKWGEKTHQCPQCNSFHSINPLKYYCTSCYRAYVFLQIDRTTFSQFLQHYALTCTQCR